jgi:uncharacterized protein YcbK (DUF882 family)
MSESKIIVIDGVQGVWTPDKPTLAPGYLSPHFRRTEFACNHCHELPKDPPDDLLDLLELIREWFTDKPVTITSGYRCPVHNANVGGVRNSTHLQGIAADIQVSGVLAKDVYAACTEIMDGSGGLGRYDTFTHVDARDKSARW